MSCSIGFGGPCPEFMKCESQFTLVGPGNSPRSSALTGAGGSQGKESCMYPQEWPLCAAGNLHPLEHQ